MAASKRTKSKRSRSKKTRSKSRTRRSKSRTRRSRSRTRRSRSKKSRKRSRSRSKKSGKVKIELKAVNMTKNELIEFLLSHIGIDPKSPNYGSKREDFLNYERSFLVKEVKKRIDKGNNRNCVGF